MKKIIIAILVLCTIIAGIFIIKNVVTNRDDYELEKITDLKYFIFKEGEKYGVIDKSGNIIINANYEEIIIPNPEKDVFVCQNEDSTVVLNANKQKLFQDFEEVEPIKLKNVATALSYEKSILKYKKDGLYGLIDFDGNIITKNIYKSIENLQPTEGKFLVEISDKKGVIDLSGKTLVPTKYDGILSDEYYTEKDGYKKSGLIVFDKTDEGYRYGYINYKGKTILENKFNGITRVQADDDNAYLIVSDDGKQGVYKNAKKIIDHEYTDIDYDENNGILIVQKNKKYGAMSISRKNNYRYRI